MGFLVGPLLLTVAVGAALLLKHFQPLELFGYAIGFLIVGSLLWVTISTLWPPEANRTCPACGSEGIVRLDPKTTVGLRCQDCGWKDPDQSAWLLAEDDGPLEEIVLAEKRGWTPTPSETRREST